MDHVTDFSGTLEARQWSGCPSGWYRSGNYCRRGDWYSWGRWVMAGIVVVLFIATLMVCMVVSRRRRRRGMQPYYGTGWLASGNKHNQQNNPNNYNMNNYGPGYNQSTYPQQDAYGGNFQNPPPAYGQQQAQYTGSTFNPNDGYYGQQTGVQQPPHAYQRDDQYAPPTGPPPGK